MDTIVVCRNSQGTEVRATTLRVYRHAVVFEVYNPYSIVQLSEVLSEFRMIVNDKTIYSGRAVVTNMVNTGTMLVCEATLVEGWQDLDVFTLGKDAAKLRSDFADFLQEWTKIRAILPEFKVIIADMQTLLMDLRSWFEQVELGIRSQPATDQRRIEREVIDKLSAQMVPAVNDLFSQFESVAANIDESSQPVHHAYVRRQLHPLVLCSPFAYRTYQKPLGYAGDYEMVNMILRDPLEGSSLFAKAINLWFWNQGPALAHRNRVKYLAHRLTEETRQCVAQGKTPRIFNLGCGPAKELEIFLQHKELGDQTAIDLVDFNSETLAYTGNAVNELKKRYQVRTEIQFIQRSVHQILKDTGKSIAGARQYDIVYCAGLFDYFSDRICKRLVSYFYDMLAPGGLLLVTNVDISNPERYGMEYLLEWYLIHRSQEQLHALRPDQVAPENAIVKADDTGVNIFLEIRKPGQ